MFSVEIDRTTFSAITPYGISLVETGILDFVPIILTHTWLKKFGFDDPAGDPGDHYWKYGNFFINRTHSDEHFMYITRNDNDRIKIRYVHELQNLYFALYQKELELTGLDSKS